MRESVFGPRMILATRDWPTLQLSTIDCASAADLTALPSSSWMRSNFLKPALAAGVSGATASTSAPEISGSSTFELGSALFCFAESGVSVDIDMPRYACAILRPCESSRMAFSAVSMGMAKPMPAALARMAVLMPITSPNSLRRGPPELPGLMAASVWMKFTFLFGMPTSAAERCSDETIPRVTVESSPTAFPIAMTQSPTCRSSERPSGAVGSLRPVGLILTAARSM